MPQRKLQISQTPPPQLDLLSTWLCPSGRLRCRRSYLTYIDSPLHALTLRSCQSCRCHPNGH
ncbi:hypothetical protein RB213_015542 [Colletotrichum asianum]